MSVSIRKLNVAQEMHAEIQKANNGTRPISFDVLNSIPEWIKHFSFLLNDAHNPLACFFVFKDDTPIGFFNLGLTGNKVKDNKHGK